MGKNAPRPFEKVFVAWTRGRNAGFSFLYALQGQMYIAYTCRSEYECSVYPHMGFEVSLTALPATRIVELLRNPPEDRTTNLNRKEERCIFTNQSVMEKGMEKKLCNTVLIT